MNVVILDHHFHQDIGALVDAAPEGTTIRTISPYFFAGTAERYFPREVWNTDLSVYHAQRYRTARAAYRREAFRLTRELHQLYPFDVFVSPSDTFFYIRDVIDACHELGVPFVVVQKELGVSARTLEVEAIEIRKWFPFAGDWMTTCSTASLRFWVASGARVEQVSVVGQPRFDYYTKNILSAPPRSGASRKILFLSYDFDVYDETRGKNGPDGPWKEMHRETEGVLRSIAERGLGQIFLKPHPQQNSVTLASIKERLGDCPAISILNGSHDTRELISDADVVVGFQSTAMAEAMIAGKRVLYTIWGDRVTAVRHLLLPYHECADSIEVCGSSKELENRLTNADWLGLTSEQSDARRAFVEKMLGPFDGKASIRVWGIIRELTVRWRGATSSQERRAQWFESRDLHNLRWQKSRASVRLFLVSIASALTVVAFGKTSMAARGLMSRIRHEKDRLIETSEAISGTFRPLGRIAGRDDILLSTRLFRMILRTTRGR